MTPAETPTECETCPEIRERHQVQTLNCDFHRETLHRQLAEAKADWKAAALREANAVKEIVSIEAQLAEKDARIRELEWLVAWWENRFNAEVEAQSAHARILMDERDAALARSSEVPK